MNKDDNSDIGNEWGNTLFEAFKLANNVISMTKGSKKKPRKSAAAIYKAPSKVTVSERAGVITIEGLNGTSLTTVLKKLFGTGKVATNMFIRMTPSGTSFYSFFAPDVHYILTSIIEKNVIGIPKRSVNIALEQLVTNTWLSRINAEPTPIFKWENTKRLKLQPLEHQADFLKQFERNTVRYGLNGYLLAAPPGGGKTLTGLYMAEMIDAHTVIVIAPKNAVYDPWVKTVETQYYDKQTYWSSDSNTLPTPGKKFYIVHYEYLEKLVDAVDDLGIKNPVIILDESHNFNTIKSLRTSKLLELVKLTEPQQVLFASGTPLKALGNEVIPLLRSIDPLFNPMAEAAYAKVYGVSQSRAVDILAHRIGLISYTVEKSLIVDNKTTYKTINVKIPNGNEYTLENIKRIMSTFIDERSAYYNENKERYHDIYWGGIKYFEGTLARSEWPAYELYKENFEEIAGKYDPLYHKTEAPYCNKYEKEMIIPRLPREMKNDFKAAKSVVKYVWLKVLGECLGRVLGKMRSQCHVDMLPHIPFDDMIDEATKKTLIFTSYVDVILEGDYVLQELGYKPLLVHGGTNKDLKSILKDYTNDIDANPLLATYQSLSTAVPLVMADTVVLLNAPFRDHEEYQAISRVDRLGQDAQVKVFKIYLDTGGEDNISTRSKDIMEWSKEQVSRLMGIKTSALDVVGIESAGNSVEDIPVEIMIDLLDNNETNGEPMSDKEEVKTIDLLEMVSNSVDKVQFKLNEFTSVTSTLATPVEDVSKEEAIIVHNRTVVPVDYTVDANTISAHIDTTELNNLNSSYLAARFDALGSSEDYADAADVVKKRMEDSISKGAVMMIHTPTEVLDRTQELFETIQRYLSKAFKTEESNELIAELNKLISGKEGGNSADLVTAIKEHVSTLNATAPMGDGTKEVSELTTEVSALKESTDTVFTVVEEVKKEVEDVARTLYSLAVTREVATSFVLMPYLISLITGYLRSINSGVEYLIVTKLSKRTPAKVEIINSIPENMSGIGNESVMRALIGSSANTVLMKKYLEEQEVGNESLVLVAAALIAGGFALKGAISKGRQLKAIKEGKQVYSRADEIFTESEVRSLAKTILDNPKVNTHWTKKLKSFDLDEKVGLNDWQTFAVNGFLSGDISASDIVEGAKVASQLIKLSKRLDDENYPLEDADYAELMDLVTKLDKVTDGYSIDNGKVGKTVTHGDLLEVASKLPPTDYLRYDDGAVLFVLEFIRDKNDDKMAENAYEKHISLIYNMLAVNEAVNETLVLNELKKFNDKEVGNEGLFFLGTVGLFAGLVLTDVVKDKLNARAVTAGRRVEVKGDSTYTPEEIVKIVKTIKNNPKDNKELIKGAKSFDLTDEPDRHTYGIRVMGERLIDRDVSFVKLSNNVKIVKELDKLTEDKDVEELQADEKVIAKIRDLVNKFYNNIEGYGYTYDYKSGRPKFTNEDLLSVAKFLPKTEYLEWDYRIMSGLRPLFGRETEKDELVYQTITDNLTDHESFIEVMLRLVTKINTTLIHKALSEDGSK